MNDRDLLAAYKATASGNLHRETQGVLPDKTGSHVIRISPYGWLRGFTLAFDRPIPNFDVASPYLFSAQLHDASGALVVYSLTAQAIYESIAPTVGDSVSPFPRIGIPPGAKAGEIPLL